MSATYPGPNEEMLAAQARVCTGPHQSRPLGLKEGDPDPGRMLELVFASLRGDLPRGEQVSEAQMGAFFAAMAIRRRFGAKTGWSEAEEETVSYHAGLFIVAVNPRRHAKYVMLDSIMTQRME